MNQQRFTQAIVPPAELPHHGMPVPTPPWLPAFLTPLELEYVDGRTWGIKPPPFSYQTEVVMRPYGPLIIALEAGDQTDFASVPRFLWSVLSPTGPYGKPAAIHDKLYRTPGLVTRAQADAIFLEAMTLLGVSRVTRQIMYRGVRLFGGHAYRGGLG